MPPLVKNLKGKDLFFGVFWAEYNLFCASFHESNVQCSLSQISSTHYIPFAVEFVVLDVGKAIVNKFESC